MVAGRDEPVAVARDELDVRAADGDAVREDVHRENRLFGQGERDDDHAVSVLLDGVVLQFRRGVGGDGE